MSEDYKNRIIELSKLTISAIRWGKEGKYVVQGRI